MKTYCLSFLEVDLAYTDICAFLILLLCIQRV